MAPTAVEIVLRQARKLHRAAKTGGISSAMPVMRRVHKAGVLPGHKLSSLYALRRQLQRKHFLRTLAIEAGFPDWERFRPELVQWPAQALAHLHVEEHFAQLNLWFSTEALARAHAAAHGGQVLRWGTQAMVLMQATPNVGSDDVA
jgi:hypothetical protein